MAGRWRYGTALVLVHGSYYTAWRELALCVMGWSVVVVVGGWFAPYTVLRVPPDLSPPNPAYTMASMTWFAALLDDPRRPLF